MLQIEQLNILLKRWEAELEKSKEDKFKGDSEEEKAFAEGLEQMLNTCICDLKSVLTQ